MKLVCIEPYDELHVSDLNSIPETPQPTPTTRKGIYLLPNLLTTLALMSGFYGIVSAMQGHFENAASAIFVAMIFDALDGRVARMTHTESAFGAQYDSLADVVNFGLAPSLIVYSWSLFQLGKPGWLAAFFYTAAVAMRLARFNAQTLDHNDFIGLPSPSGAALVAGMVWIAHDHGFQGDQLSILAAVVTIFAGILMVSNIRFSSFKAFNFKEKVPFMTLLIMLVVVLSISLDPPLVLSLGFLGYVLSGPLGAIKRHWQKDKA